jgi:hypothetical protein
VTVINRFFFCSDKHRVLGLGVDMDKLVNEPTIDVARRMDVLIFLQLDQRYPSMTEKVEKLAEAGLNSGEIGRIVGKPTNYVTATLSQGKKRKGKGKQ